MSEMGMVERVARALADGGHLGVSLAFKPLLDTDTGSIPLLKERDTERAIAAARAAIEAMREPTAGMTKMAWRVYPEGQPDGGYVNTPEVAAELWGEMIDAALTTSPST